MHGGWRPGAAWRKPQLAHDVTPGPPPMPGRCRADATARARPCGEVRSVCVPPRAAMEKPPGLDSPQSPRAPSGSTRSRPPGGWRGTVRKGGDHTRADPARNPDHPHIPGRGNGLTSPVGPRPHAPAQSSAGPTESDATCVRTDRQVTAKHALERSGPTTVRSRRGGLDELFAYSVALVYGNRAIDRARLIAWATMRCCCAVVPRRRRE
jgi:hypothetical protein